MRIKKIKSRKGKIDAGVQTCLNCKKEYKEDENFNWKCRTHRGEYSEQDDLWWCCLKKGFDTVGCRTSKHIPEIDKGSDDEDKDQLGKTQQQIKCHCCKEKGHSIENCKRDPNIKTVHKKLIP